MTASDRRAWATIICCILAGWNAFLFLFFLILFGTTAVLSRLGFSFFQLGHAIGREKLYFYVELIVTVGLSIGASFMLAGRLYAFLVTKPKKLSYLLLIILFLLTLLTFPSSFKYSI